MLYQIQNEHLIASISSLGAELCRLAGRNGIEYLCPPERRNWDGSAPILFPNTGAIKDGYAMVRGTPYPYGQHGFARRTAFQVHAQKETEITFQLHWTEETFAYYPFAFVLSIRYALEGSSLKVTAWIENQDRQRMYCSLGFHPGFACPLVQGETFEDYRLVFPEPMEATRILLRNALAYDKAKGFWKDVTEIPVEAGMFDGGSFTMTDLSSKRVRMESRKSGHYVQLDFEDYPNLVIWAPPGKEITNLCIEPWYGIPDTEDTDHDVSAKEHTICLDPGEQKELNYRITLGS